MRKLKSIFSLFTLLVFLFPLMEKEIHALEHADDIHCSSIDKHFHELEHNCELCDFTNVISDPPLFTHADFLLAELRVQNFNFTEKKTSSREKEFTSLRAPPVVS